MNYRLLLSVFCSLFWLLGSCQSNSRYENTQQWMADNGKLKTLSTTGIVGDLVALVGGPHIDNLNLITEQLDPHSYQLVKDDSEKIRRANIIFYSGLNLEHGPSLQSALKNSSKSVSLGDTLAQEYPQAILYQGGQLDPHVWMDISLWAKTVPTIAATLSQYDPIHAADYTSRAEQLVQDMLAKHHCLKQHLHTIPAHKRFVVTSHDAFNYFARAYLAEENEIQDNSWHKRFAAPEGLAPDSQLSVTDIQSIINHLDTYNILVIFPESNVSQDSIRKIIDAGIKKGLHLTMADEPLYADAMGPPGSDGDSYLKMMHHNVTAIAQYLNDNGIEAREQKAKVLPCP
jgi:manganese/zinc/iron transport system substrate-binding protein